MARRDGALSLDDPGPRILLVDDAADVRRVLLRILLQAGYRLADAMGTAREAVYAMEIEPAALVIVDVSLARGDAYPDGGAAARDIAARWPTCRVALTSGWPADYLPDHCDGMPMIGKPMLMQAFLARVAEILMAPPWTPEDG